jgi:hypothetical protein
MIKLIPVVALLFFCMTTYGQLDIPKFKDTTDQTKFPNDSLVTNLLDKSKIVITFSNYSAWTLWKNYKIISYQNDNKWHYNIFVHEDEDSVYKLLEVEAPQASIIEVWESIKTNALFSIKKVRSYDENCGRMIYDSHHYEFWIVVKNQYRKIDYNNPEYFEENCPSILERKQVINCAKTFKLFSEKYK